jgi:HAD superfamily hydrolase (TIGR01509 family)
MTPKAVIFDCDGVIVDSEYPTFQLLAQEFADYDLMLTPDQIAREFTGGTMAGVADIARAKGADLPANWVSAFYEKLYAHLALGTPLVPGILGVLDHLDARAIPYAVGSNGSDRKMQVTLGQYPGLIVRFQGRLFSGQTLGKPKPAPDLYLHAARALGVDPARCVVVEDSPTGALAARAAGMVCMGYAAAGHEDGLHAAGAVIFTDMADLPGLLGL